MSRQLYVPVVVDKFARLVPGLLIGIATLSIVTYYVYDNLTYKTIDDKEDKEGKEDNVDKEVNEGKEDNVDKENKAKH